jgi:carbon storage regulator
MPMLVLSRKVGERILIGDNIAVTVVRIGQGGVRLGIEAPGDLEVIREELQREGQTRPQSSDSSGASRIGAPK